MNRDNIKRDRMIFALITIFLIIVEFIIGLFVHDNLIRPFGGDVIVVIVLYTIVRVIIPHTKYPIALYVFIFSALYEFTQKIPLVDFLGIKNGFLRALIGTTYSSKDIICYLIGCLVCLVYDIYYFIQFKKEN